jgi:hypothetical protein
MLELYPLAERIDTNDSRFRTYVITKWNGIKTQQTKRYKTPARILLLFIRDIIKKTDFN